MAQFNKTLALATAIGSLGGFQMAPEWFINLSRYNAFQILVLAVLLWQGGGGGGDGNPFMWSVIFAVVFWSVMKLSSYVRVTSGKKLNPLTVAAEQVAVDEAEAQASSEEESPSVTPPTAEAVQPETFYAGNDTPPVQQSRYMVSALAQAQDEQAETFYAGHDDSPGQQSRYMDSALAEGDDEQAEEEGFRGFGSNNNFARY